MRHILGLTRLARLAGTLVASAAFAACGEDVTLPPASQETKEVTVTLYALTNTPVGTPSAYSIVTQLPVRTDRSSDFDFAFDLGGDGGDTAVLLPRGAIGLSDDGGLQRAAVPYDSVLIAPERGYVGTVPLVVDTGVVVIAASRRQQCNFGVFRPYYAKLLVEALDDSARTIRLRMRIDPNCGYRGLEPGTPER